MNPHTEERGMKILAVNVNTTRTMTHSIAEAARAVARPGTEIIELTPSFGADSVEGNFESYMAAVGVMDAVTTYDGDFDAVIQAGFGEHGKEGLMELLDVPVIDITEAAAHMAMLIGHRFSVVTTLDRTVPGIEDRLLCFGLSAHCASVRSSGLGVLELEDADAARRAVIAQARRAGAGGRPVAHRVGRMRFQQTHGGDDIAFRLRHLFPVRIQNPPRDSGLFPRQAIEL